MTTPTMGFDAMPVVDDLKNVFAIFVYFQFDHDQSSAVTQRNLEGKPESVTIREAKGQTQWRKNT